MEGEELPRLRRPDKLRVVDRAARSLEEAILMGETPPGTRLVEQTLATQLGVSRTTVREALLLLERQGLVESTPRGGTFVTGLSSSAAWDVRRIRALLESYAVRTGFPAYDAAFFAALRGIAAQIRESTIPRDLPRLVTLDLNFHQLIVARAHSPHLLELWATLNGKIRALYLTTVERLTIPPARIAALHDELIDDLASGDLLRAQRGAVQHYLGGWPPMPAESVEMHRILGLPAIDSNRQTRDDHREKRSS